MLLLVAARLELQVRMDGLEEEARGVGGGQPTA
jgi:hypothetical protein